MTKGIYPSVVCLLTGGPLYQIYVEGVWIVFEIHPYCGPMPLDKRSLEERRLGPRHKFWEAATLWVQQGQQTGRETGGVKCCIWSYQT